MEKTSYLRNAPETGFLGNRPREMELQQENKLLIKENNYLEGIINRMMKALMENRPEKGQNAMDLFAIKNHEVSQQLGHPEVFLHRFEFLEPLMQCYDEKISRLEKINQEAHEKLQILEKTFDDVSNFYKQTLEEKDRKLLNFFKDKFESDETSENSDFFFQYQLLQAEQRDYLKVLQEEKTLNDQRIQDLRMKLSRAQAEKEDLQTKFDIKQAELEKIVSINTRLELKLKTLSDQNESFKMKNGDLAKNITEYDNKITELKAEMQRKEKEWVMNNKKMALQEESGRLMQDQASEEIGKLRKEVQKLTEKDGESRHKIIALTTELSELKNSIEQLEKEKADLEDRLNESNENVEKLESRVAELVRSEDSLRKKEKSNEELIFKLSSRADQLENTKLVQDKKLESYKESYESELMKIGKESDSRIEIIEAQYKSEIELKEEELLKSQGELYTLKVNLERANKENAKLAQTIKEMTVSSTESQKIILEKTRIIKELRGRLSVLDDDLNRRVLSMTFEKNSLESTLDSLKDEMGNRDEKVKTLNSTINGLNSEKGRLREHVENLMREKQELVGKLESLRRRLQERHEDLIEENLFRD